VSAGQYVHGESYNSRSKAIRAAAEWTVGAPKLRADSEEICIATIRRRSTSQGKFRGGSARGASSLSAKPIFIAFDGSRRKASRSREGCRERSLPKPWRFKKKAHSKAMSLRGQFRWKKAACFPGSL